MAQDVVPGQHTDDGQLELSLQNNRMRSNARNGELQNSSDVARPLIERHPSIEPDSTGSSASELSFSTSSRQRPSTGFLTGKWGVLVGLGIGLGLGIGVLPRFMSSSPSPSSLSPAAEVAEGAGVGQVVTMAVVESTQIARTLDATGTVVASDLLPILAKAPGLQIQQVLVDEGDLVRVGQPLAVLDQSVIRTQIAGAEANLQAAKATVVQREAALAQSKARLAEAQANLARYQNLADQGAVSQEELDTRATTATTAQEEVRVADANISSAKAMVLSEEAQIQQLNTQLGQSLVTAPASGIVAERFARVGNVTSSSQSLFTIIRDRLLELEVSIPETQLPSIQIGNTVAISSDADPQLRLQGRVQDIAPLIDPQTRQAKVKISLPDSLKLRPGMFLRAALTTDNVQGLVIPSAAVLPQPNGSALVYRLSNNGDRNQAQAQVVEMGELLDTGTTDFMSGSSVSGSRSAHIEILQGLNIGDRVVVEGAGYLKDGDHVEIVSN